MVLISILSDAHSKNHGLWYLFDLHLRLQVDAYLTIFQKYYIFTHPLTNRWTLIFFLAISIYTHTHAHTFFDSYSSKRGKQATRALMKVQFGKMHQEFFRAWIMNHSWRARRNIWRFRHWENCNNRIWSKLKCRHLSCTAGMVRRYWLCILFFHNLIRSLGDKTLEIWRTLSENTSDI